MSFAVGLAGAVFINRLIGGWWLNSGAGVVAMLTAVFVLGTVTSALLRQWWLRIALTMSAGALVGSTIVLFRVRPGTIWPMVLVVAGCFSAAAAMAGSLLGTQIRK